MNSKTGMSRKTQNSKKLTPARPEQQQKLMQQKTLRLKDKKRTNPFETFKISRVAFGDRQRFIVVSAAFSSLGMSMCQ
jgi:hypothetical protein